MQLSPSSCQTFHVCKRFLRPHSWSRGPTLAGCKTDSSASPSAAVAASLLSDMQLVKQQWEKTSSRGASKCRLMLKTVLIHNLQPQIYIDGSFQDQSNRHWEGNKSFLRNLLQFRGLVQIFQCHTTSNDTNLIKSMLLKNSLFSLMKYFKLQRIKVTSWGKLWKLT